MADVSGNLIGSINRNFRGFGREIMTDTGQYVLRMDAASPETTNIQSSGVVSHFPRRQVELIAPPPSSSSRKRANSFGKPGKSSSKIVDLQGYVQQLNKSEKSDQARLKRGLSLQKKEPNVQLIERTGAKGLTLDQRAVMLATAVSIDFDYFSHKSGYSPPS